MVGYIVGVGIYCFSNETDIDGPELTDEDVVTSTLTTSPSATFASSLLSEHNPFPPLLAVQAKLVESPFT